MTQNTATQNTAPATDAAPDAQRRPAPPTAAAT